MDSQSQRRAHLQDLEIGNVLDDISSFTPKVEVVYNDMDDVKLPTSPPPLPMTLLWQDSIRVGQWITGLFSCFEFCVPNGFMACCCTSVTLAQVASRIRLMSFCSALVFFGVLSLMQFVLMAGILLQVHQEQHDQVKLTWQFVGFVGSFACVWLFKSFLVMLLRRRLRQRFKIPGSFSRDCFVASCCTSCGAAQMATHVESFLPGSCGFGPRDQLPAYNNQ